MVFVEYVVESWESVRIREGVSPRVHWVCWMRYITFHSLNSQCCFEQAVPATPGAPLGKQPTVEVLIPPSRLDGDSWNLLEKKKPKNKFNNLNFLNTIFFQSRMERRVAMKRIIRSISLNAQNSLNPFRTAVPFWGKKQSNSKWFVPKNGAAVLKGLKLPRVPPPTPAFLPCPSRLCPVEFRQRKMCALEMLDVWEITKNISPDFNSTVHHCFRISIYIN